MKDLRVHEPVAIHWDSGTPLVLSRDLRARRNNSDWLVHFRADAPVNYGLRLSDGAFNSLVEFSQGARPRRFRDAQRNQFYHEMIERFINPGFILSSSYRIRGTNTRISFDEIMRLREAIDTEILGLLELECLLLYLLARENLSAEPICELGSLMGGSTIALALGAKNGVKGNRVLAVDDHEWHRHLAQGSFSVENVRRLPSTLPQFLNNLEAARVTDQVDVMIKDTVRAAEDYTGSISMLFIDANHALEGVIGDFEAWFPKLSSGGFVVFHDYGNSTWPGVKSAVDSFLSHFSGFASYQTLAIGVKP